jgi:hypothetical protein
MTIDKQNPTQQRQQPLSLSDAISSLTTGDLDLTLIRSMQNARRNPEEQRIFLKAVLEQAIEIAESVDDCLSEESSSEKTDGEEEENKSSQNK